MSLRELPRVQQVTGEARRRWFHGHEMDLVIWEGAEGAPLGFQLAYDKHRNEHSIEWRAGRGFVHYQVDDGEAMALSKETPFLYHDGAFERDRVLAQFLAVAGGLPATIREFVAARLSEFEDAGGRPG
ncbi:MAG: hypothetical protein HZB40_05310 [Rhodocyclales bacterium]|nr:hypothetical protein [Rhodocyclales bacterium]